MITRWLAIALLFLLAASISCGGQGEDGPKAKGADASGLTAENFFPRLEEAITREGLVFHTSTETVIQGFVDTASVQPAWTTEVWLEVAREQGRMEFLKDPSFEGDLSDSETLIILRGAVYADDEAEVRKRKARVCPVMESPLLSLLMFNCAAVYRDVAPGEVKVDVEYGGQPSVAMVHEALFEVEPQPPGEPKLRRITTSFYADRKSLLPLAWVAESRDDVGRLLGTLTTRYESEFVALSSLPSGFLDPVSIGYVEKDPAAPLNDPNLGVTVYWLGREFAPPGELSRLAFSLASGPLGPGQSHGNKADIEYVLAEDESGAPPEVRPTQVRLQLWRLQDWQDFLGTPLGSLWWESPCVQTKEVSLEHGQAIIFMGSEPEAVLPAAPVPATPSAEETRANPLAATPAVAPSPTPGGECPTGPFNRFLAHAYLGDTVVAVNAPHCLVCARRGHESDPYDTLEGMEAVVAGLRPRATGE